MKREIQCDRMIRFYFLHFPIYLLVFYKQMCDHGNFFVFSFFLTQILQKKYVGASWIRTQIIGVEGKHTDNLTTTITQFT